METLLGLLYAYPVECIVGGWLLVALIGLYSSTRCEYTRRTLGGMRRHRRDSNKYLNEERRK